jgi:hypothetical protein
VKILYVVNRPLEINTSASLRNKTTICGLVAVGHDVEILTTEPDTTHPAYDPSLALNEVKAHLIKVGGMNNLTSVGRGIELLAPLRSTVYKLFNKNRIYDRLDCTIRYIDKIKIDISDYDLIISSSDPKSSHLLVLEMINKNKSFSGKWIQIWGDPFIGDITALKKNENKIQKEEQRLLERVDRVIYVSAMTLEQQKKLYPKYAKKMMFIPIPYMERKYYDLCDLKKKQEIRMAYCGDYNSTVRNILPLYEFATNTKKIHLTICGMSDLELHSNENVSVNPRVSHQKVVEIEDNADILVHLSNRFGSQIPGKIYQYSSNNKPVLFILDGDEEQLLRIFEKYHRFVFSKNSANEIEKAVEQIVNSKEPYKPIHDFAKENVARDIIRDI